MIDGRITSAARALRTLAHPLRLSLLCLLQAGPKNVGELVAMTGSNQSSLSHHLARLRLAGIVACERRQQHVYYHISDGETGRLVALLDTFYRGEASAREMTS